MEQIYEKLTKIAGYTRELTNTTDKLGLDAIGENLGAVVQDVNTQDSLIEQIAAALVDELLSRRRKPDAQFYVTAMIFDAYFTMNKDEWINQENKEYRAATEKRFKAYYLKFKKLYDTIPADAKAQIIMSIKNRMYTEGLLMESITFEDWIKQVEAL